MDELYLLYVFIRLKSFILSVLFNFISLDFKRSITLPHRLLSDDKIESRLKLFIFGIKYLYNYNFVCICENVMNNSSSFSLCNIVICAI